MGVATVLLTAAAPAAKPAAAPDWTKVVVATPEGGFRVGNPAAKVKLIEYGSFTCPHCAHFHDEAMSALKTRYIAGGKVSFEFRNFVLNAPDYAAALLARCDGPTRFFGLHDRFFAEQPRWTQPFTQQSAADGERIAALPAEKQIGAIAEAGKLDDFVAPLGVTSARFNACVNDKAALDKLLDMRKAAVETFKVQGTPTFIINGKTVDDTNTWAALEPGIKAALR